MKKPPTIFLTVPFLLLTGLPLTACGTATSDTASSNVSSPSSSSSASTSTVSQVETVEGYPVVRVPVDASTVTVPVGTVLLFDYKTEMGEYPPVGLSQGFSVYSTDDSQQVVNPVTGRIPQNDIRELRDGWIAVSPGATDLVLSYTLTDESMAIVDESERTYTIVVVE